MNAATLIIGLIFIAAWGLGGYKLGQGRGRPRLGATLCALLGLIGMLIFLAIPRTPEAKARHEREKAAKAQSQPGLRPPGSGPDWTTNVPDAQEQNVP